MAAKWHDYRGARPNAAWVKDLREPPHPACLGVPSVYGPLQTFAIKHNRAHRCGSVPRRADANNRSALVRTRLTLGHNQAHAVSTSVKTPPGCTLHCGVIFLNECSSLGAGSMIPRSYLRPLARAPHGQFYPAPHAQLPENPEQMYFGGPLRQM